MNLVDFSGLKAKGINFSKTHLWRLMKDGKFPAPIDLGTRRRHWLVSEVDEWVAAKAAERDRSAA